MCDMTHSQPPGVTDDVKETCVCLNICKEDL